MMSNLVTNLTTFLTEIAYTNSDDTTVIRTMEAVNEPVLGCLGIMSNLVGCLEHDV